MSSQKPFLRWAGGKRFLVTHLLRFFPTDFDKCYFEPFLGAGALFFNVCPKKAVLSDSNAHLIDCFNAVRLNPDLVYRYLKEHRKNDSEIYYYSVREKFNKSIKENTVAQAARFIYLNRSCFNGIYRVNKQGKFNVPYGKKENLIIPSRSELEEYSNALTGSTVKCCDYKNILAEVTAGDFIYLDPPYPPLNGSSYFTHYTKDRFSLEDQESVFEFADQLKKKDCSVLISNADTEQIRLLYQDWNLYELDVTRYISCKSRKHKVRELMITNYSEMKE